MKGHVSHSVYRSLKSDINVFTLKFLGALLLLFVSKSLAFACASGIGTSLIQTGECQIVHDINRKTLGKMIVGAQIRYSLNLNEHVAELSYISAECGFLKTDIPLFLQAAEKRMDLIKQSEDEFSAFLKSSNGRCSSLQQERNGKWTMYKLRTGKWHEGMQRCAYPKC